MDELKSLPRGPSKNAWMRYGGAPPGQLHSMFAEAVEPEKIAGASGCRERLFPADVTFWGMLGQVFRGGSLRDAVRRNTGLGLRGRMGSGT